MDQDGLTNPATNKTESGPLHNVDINVAPHVERDLSVLLPSGERQVARDVESQHDGLNDEEDQDGSVSVTAGAQKAPKKKKKKSKGQKGAKPTGFEEYYVDAPLTPEEFEEEKALYDESRTFSERIETAIQRYKAKRNMKSEHSDIFDKYMVFGGIDSGPKMFSGGLDTKTFESKTAAEIAIMTATNFVNSDKDDDDADFVVDFDGCVKGFLSSRLPWAYELLTEKQIAFYTSVVRNFLNYLLHHDVCPEYKDQINAARVSCDRAEKELWVIAQLSDQMPGDFNKACSTIFGGFYESSYTQDQTWAQGVELHFGMRPETARKMFKTGLAAQGTDETIEQFQRQESEQSVHVTSTLTTGLEVTEIIFADAEIRALYDDQKMGSKCLGRMKARTWDNPAAAGEDLTEEEEATAAPKEIKTYEFWVEDSLLQKLCVGMKFETTVRQLSFGISYLDAITATYCSFYQVLPNEKYLGWREHEYLPPRGPMHPDMPPITWDMYNEDLGGDDEG